MNYNIDYGYTTYLAFLMNLKYNKSRKLSIKSLIIYPTYLVNLLLDLKDENIYIKMINNYDNFDNFIVNNKDIFSVTKDGYIILNGTITVNDLYRILDIYNYPFTDLAINIIKSNDSIKKILNLNGIQKILNSFNTLENKAEKLYLKDDISEYETIKYLQRKRNDFYRKLIKFGSETITDFEDEANFMSIDPYDENNYPIDSENNYELLVGDSIDEILASPYLIAYFTNTTLSMLRISEDIANISLKYCYFSDYSNDKEFIENIENDINDNADNNFNHSLTFRSKIELFFTLTLIKKLDEFISNDLEDFTKESLNQTKKRLIYMIDNNLLNLFDKDNFDKVYNKYLEDFNNGKFYTDDFEEISFNVIERYGSVAKTLIYDIFEGINAGINNDEIIIKKLAFIKTYYSLTKDRELLLILNKYADNNNFWEYNKYLRNDNIKLERRNNG